MMHHRLSSNHPFNLNHAIHDETFSNVIGAIFSILSLFMIYIGVSGIIEYKSPEYLASLATLSSGFMMYFEHHALIIFGALGFTFSVWFAGKN